MAAAVAAWGGAPARLGEQERVGDLQWAERDPFRGSARAEVVWTGGVDGEQELRAAPMLAGGD